MKSITENTIYICLSIYTLSSLRVICIYFNSPDVTQVVYLNNKIYALFFGVSCIYEGCDHCMHCMHEAEHGFWGFFPAVLAIPPEPV